MALDEGAGPEVPVKEDVRAKEHDKEDVNNMEDDTINKDYRTKEGDTAKKDASTKEDDSITKDGSVRGAKVT